MFNAETQSWHGLNMLAELPLSLGFVVSRCHIICKRVYVHICLISWVLLWLFLSAILLRSQSRRHFHLLHVNSYLTPPLFHSGLKTYLFHESFLTQTFPTGQTDLTGLGDCFAVLCFLCFFFVFYICSSLLTISGIQYRKTREAWTIKQIYRHVDRQTRCKQILVLSTRLLKNARSCEQTTWQSSFCHCSCLIWCHVCLTKLVSVGVQCTLNVSIYHGTNNRQTIVHFLSRCMKCRRGLTMRILSVRPSVRLSNACILTKQKKNMSRYLWVRLFATKAEHTKQKTKSRYKNTKKQIQRYTICK